MPCPVTILTIPEPLGSLLRSGICTGSYLRLCGAFQSFFRAPPVALTLAVLSSFPLAGFARALGRLFVFGLPALGFLLTTLGTTLGRLLPGRPRGLQVTVLVRPVPLGFGTLFLARLSMSIIAVVCQTFRNFEYLATILALILLLWRLQLHVVPTSLRLPLLRSCGNTRSRVHGIERHPTRLGSHRRSGTADTSVDDNPGRRVPLAALRLARLGVAGVRPSLASNARSFCRPTLDRLGGGGVTVGVGLGLVRPSAGCPLRCLPTLSVGHRGLVHPTSSFPPFPIAHFRLSRLGRALRRTLGRFSAL
mmetsp:Transcript_74131/g.169796  ORF Transcript_74131/g.169796 Transcript_74131/m.169796 type:complete len:306 (-) Transcript_74131:62-979(-)